ncbi:binding-protein-dependent transport systems inner membrane component [Haloterrigena turkmenica DSM 5511]|uniref:Binding-protein-dependent transport systems inner membrane component n=1 Tax=Haloterrigena turkmenica (strain ATCC 51198 / DSM 5511 / JCM 9101 / NCIMB 13204 / VKM B-1734 / 4k) TaxID=543526 RepID=D2RSB9_HALTV|nr:carbohydrate ABC transporter permease [Haloterrigena turkmenica]ADB60700.1 binding-protein-dependent transport systems inner membrane component [Haloterrigena turkmenica DSM 5511]
MSEKTVTTEQAASTEHETGGISIGHVGLYATLIGLVGFYLLPIESGLVTSIKTPTALQETFPFLPPLSASGVTVEKWQVAFEYLAPGMVNSVLFTIPSTILCAILGSMAAYGLTLVNWRGQIAVLALFIAGIFVPYQAVIVPLFQFWSQYMQLSARLSFLWGLPLLERHHATILELIITHTAYGVPIVTLLFRSQYKTMSGEMIEAARLDGASVWRVYRRIVLPLSIPMFAVVFIFQFTQIWNEFLFSLTIIGSVNNPAASATLILSGLGQSLEGTDYPLRMAGAFITALPTLLVYVLFADKFAEGVQT